MFLIKVKGDFSAAHRICGYPGDCANLHGHNWRISATIGVEKLDELGMACDFRVAKSILREILSRFDHKNLNEHEQLDGGNPTSERIAIVIYEEIKKKLPDYLTLEAVEVFESDTSSVEYRAT